MDETNLCALVRKAESDYKNGKTKIGRYVDYSMADTIERITAILNSKHLSGPTDSLGREKPYFNIATAVTNIWYRATDIDRKDIRVYNDVSSETPLAFVANVLLHNWMDRERFGVFLNAWGRSLARYGSSVVKFVKSGGRLIPSWIPWSRLIVDPVDFQALPVIEKFYKTPAQLRKIEGYDKNAVKGLIEATGGRQNLDKEAIDNKSGFIELYEIHGELSKAVYNKSKGLEVKEGDEDVYFQQMHVVSFVETDKGEYDEYTLFSGREEKSPYMLTHLIEEDGRTLSIGAVEYLFDSQWMMNHTLKQQKDYLDLASKLIFQTSDSNYLGRNVLSSIETGTILTHVVNQPLTQVNNSAMNLNALMEFGNQWKALSQDITSTPDAYRGTTLPSGTPYALSALLSQQAGSLFELMTENKGLAIEDMLREFVIPFVMTQMDTSEEIASTLDERGIAEIDAMYVPREAVKQYNKKFVDAVIQSDGKSVLSPFNPQVEQAQVKSTLASLGNRRFFKPSDIKTTTWKKLLADFEWKVKVEVTNENSDKQAVLQTLSTALQTIAANPAILQDQNAKMLFGKILSATGTVSPLELSTTAPVGGSSGGLPVAQPTNG